MEEFDYIPSDAYISKMVVNRKLKKNLESDVVTEVKLYSSSKNISYYYYQCNLGAVVNVFHNNEQIFVANIEYASLVDFLVDPTDPDLGDKIEHTLKTVIPKEVLFNLLRNKIYTVMMESEVSPIMLSDYYPYECIDLEDNEEQKDNDDEDYYDDEDEENGGEDDEEDYFDEEEDDFFDDEEDFFGPDEIAKENERLEKEASKYTYKWLIDNARKKVEGRELLKSLSDESVCLRFNFTTQAQFFYNFFNFPKYFLPDYVASCNSDFEFILYSLIFGEADNIKSDNNYIPSLYFTWRGTEYYLLKLEKDLFEKIIVEMFIQSFETGRKILKLQPDYILIEDIAGDANVKINDFYALFADPSAEKKEFCNEIHKRIKDCNSLYNLTTLID